MDAMQPASPSGLPAVSSMTSEEPTHLLGVNDSVRNERRESTSNAPDYESKEKVLSKESDGILENVSLHTTEATVGRILPKIAVSSITPEEGPCSSAYLSSIEALALSLANNGAAVLQLSPADAQLLHCALLSARHFFMSASHTQAASSSPLSTGKGLCSQPGKDMFLYRAGRLEQQRAKDLVPACLPEAHNCMAKIARLALGALCRHLKMRTDSFHPLLDDCPLNLGEVSSSVLIASLSQQHHQHGQQHQQASAKGTAQGRQTEAKREEQAALTAAPAATAAHTVDGDGDGNSPATVTAAAVDDNPTAATVAEASVAAAVGSDAAAVGSDAAAVGSDAAAAAEADTSGGASGPSSIESEEVEMERGLLSLVVADSPGVQVRDVHGKWQAVDQAVPPSCLLLLPGQTLQHLTAGIFRATPFRLNPSPAADCSPQGAGRSALSFHLMPRPSALIDCSLLAAAGFDVPFQYCKPQTAADLMASLTSSNAEGGPRNRSVTNEIHLAMIRQVEATSLRSCLSDPISGSLLSDALLAPCGHSFGGAGLRALRQSMVCPDCHLPLDALSLTPNIALRAAAAAFEKEQAAAGGVGGAGGGGGGGGGGCSEQGRGGAKGGGGLAAVVPRVKMKKKDGSVKVTKRKREAKEGDADVRKQQRKVNKEKRDQLAMVSLDTSLPPDAASSPVRGKGVQFPFVVNDFVLIKGNKRTPEKFVGRAAVITSQCLNGWYLVRTLDTGESVRLQYRSLQKMRDDSHLALPSGQEDASAALIPLSDLHTISLSHAAADLIPCASPPFNSSTPITSPSFSSHPTLASSASLHNPSLDTSSLLQPPPHHSDAFHSPTLDGNGTFHAAAADGFLSSPEASGQLAKSWWIVPSMGEMAALLQQEEEGELRFEASDAAPSNVPPVEVAEAATPPFIPTLSAADDDDAAASGEEGSAKVEGETRRRDSGEGSALEQSETSSEMMKKRWSVNSKGSFPTSSRTPPGSNLVLKLKASRKMQGEAVEKKTPKEGLKEGSREVSRESSKEVSRESWKDGSRGVSSCAPMSLKMKFLGSAARANKGGSFESSRDGFADPGPASTATTGALPPASSSDTGPAVPVPPKKRDLMSKTFTSTHSSPLASSSRPAFVEEGSRLSFDVKGLKADDKSTAPHGPQDPTCSYSGAQHAKDNGKIRESQASHGFVSQSLVKSEKDDTATVVTSVLGSGVTMR